MINRPHTATFFEVTPVSSSFTVYISQSHFLVHLETTVARGLQGMTFRGHPSHRIRQLDVGRVRKREIEREKRKQEKWEVGGGSYITPLFPSLYTLCACLTVRRCPCASLLGVLEPSIPPLPLTHFPQPPPRWLVTLTSHPHPSRYPVVIFLFSTLKYFSRQVSVSSL